MVSATFKLDYSFACFLQLQRVSLKQLFYKLRQATSLQISTNIIIKLDYYFKLHYKLQLN